MATTVPTLLSPTAAATPSTVGDAPTPHESELLSSARSDGSSARSPRSSFFGRRSRSESMVTAGASGLQEPPLLQCAVSINGRLGLATTTTLVVTQSSICYGRYIIPLVDIERAGYDEASATLVIEFSFRSKPKQFQMANSSDCRAICQLLSELLSSKDDQRSADDRAPDRGVMLNRGDTTYLFSGLADHVGNVSGALGAMQPPSALQLPAEDDARGVGITIAPSPGADLSRFATRPPPEWLIESLSHLSSREWAEDAYMRVRSGWCCYKYALEATLFGVLMPLAIAGYWLSDATTREAPYSNRYLHALCSLHGLVLAPRQVYHHGKYADAKDLAYQEGNMWRLEPAFNTSVRLLDDVVDRRTRRTIRHWPSTWTTNALTSVVEEERPHCDGEVLMSLMDAEARCAKLETWVPHEVLMMGTAAAANAAVKLPFSAATERAVALGGGGGGGGSDGNSTEVACFVDRRAREVVYLDIEGAFLFYVDVLLIVALVLVAAAFALCLFEQHKPAIRGWWRACVGGEQAGTTATEGSFSMQQQQQQRVSHGNGGFGSSSSGGGLPSGSPTYKVLTPDNLKRAYENVTRGFNEMV